MDRRAKKKLPHNRAGVQRGPTEREALAAEQLELLEALEREPDEQRPDVARGVAIGAEHQARRARTRDARERWQLLAALARDVEREPARARQAGETGMCVVRVPWSHTRWRPRARSVARSRSVAPGRPKPPPARGHAAARDRGSSSDDPPDEPPAPTVAGASDGGADA